MKLFAKVVTFQGGYDCDKKDIKASGYQIGDMFEVSFVDMGQSYTSIYDAKDNKSYNSVYFDFFNDMGNQIDIYKSPYYNPYIQNKMI